METVIAMKLLGGRFGYLLFFLLGDGVGGVRSAGREGGGRFLMKVPGEGGGFSREGEGPRGREGVCGELGNSFGGGLNIFFRGRNVHQD